MIKTVDIVFDDRGMMSFKSDFLNDTLRLELSTELRVYYDEDDISEDYKGKIATFANEIAHWYEIAISRVIEHFSEQYQAVLNCSDIKLMSICTLFEQDATQEVYGLNFRVNFDEEHDAGLQMYGKTFGIKKVGTADISFRV